MLPFNVEQKFAYDGLGRTREITLGGLNLYAYCCNNPVMNVAPTGEAFLSFLILSIIIGAVVGGAINTYKAYNEGASGWGLVGAFAGGRAGLFNKPLTKMGSEDFLQYVVNKFSKVSLSQSFVYGTNILISNFFARFLLCTIPGAGTRWLMKKL